ncbi:HNH endonuclease [Acinetobacter baumannii]|uniref:HNH endonuclease n=1 Tax=Acinetobacter baumannii TaxID=470 RepID=UPI0004487220|nr:HNH endonuclease [Acinetobacter baumannii]EXH48833.1 bacteriophage Lambda NinG family protein [Acinetobacter baumannii 1412924]MDC4332085.1 hypothetical protein [Acinetobacter baumannii]MDC5531218.1 hypothetical protein [Acinetobacter baumannii]MDH2465361.1 hypothetical protein [Acinetobacter baumannii]MDI9707291.1 hypothetical protein [Acinetobacter baumannii]
MFEIIRSLPAPTDLAKNKYNTAPIVEALAEICYSKCYLCENDEVQEVEVEHFLPHSKHPHLKFEWDNLFYSCKRCNRIKGDNYEYILNPCDSSHNVFRNIRLIPPSRLNDEITIENLCPESDSLHPNVEKTRDLLEKCFNDVSTPARRISRTDLINRLLDELAEILQIRGRLKSKRLTPNEENEEIEKLKKMTSPQYPFSAFWRWYVLDDLLLFSKMGSNINF